MSFGSSTFGSSPYGGSSGSFAVQSATALNAYTVEVAFTTDVDGSSLTLNPASYTIPGLQVVQVVLAPQPNSIRLIVTQLAYITYELTVSPNIESAYGDEMSIPGNVVSFSGWPVDAGFTARALSSMAVQILFPQTMKMSSAMTDTANFLVTDLSGVPVPLLSVVPNNPSNILRARLNLGAALVAGKPYAVHITDQVLTADDRILVPSNANFAWYNPKPLVSIPLSRFTGEVQAVPQSGPGVSETLMLSESLGISIEPSQSVGNVGTLLTSTFEEGLSGDGEAVDLDGTEEDGSSISQNVRLQTRVDPFDPARPNYVTSYEWSLRETVEVTYTNSTTNESDLAVGAEEKLFISEQVRAERPRSYLASETLTLREEVRILPEPREGLDASTKNLFGTPNGQVFFSPSLIPGSLGQSTIKVDEVQVCTRAYDVYKPPAEEDPVPLYTHGGGIVPAINTTLSPGVVLFAPFVKLTGAKTNVGFKPKDPVDRPVDVGASILLTQIYDPARFSLLNNAAWHLFDNTGLPFVVADNLSPVGAPVVGPGTYFANPAEDHVMVESIATSAALSVSVAESLTLIEETHHFPGANQVVVSLSETLNLGEVVTPVP